MLTKDRLCTIMTDYEDDTGILSELSPKAKPKITDNNLFILVKNTGTKGGFFCPELRILGLYVGNIVKN